MKTWQSVVISLSVGSVLAGTGWWLLRRSNAAPPSKAATAAVEAPKNLPHEKAFLEDELKKSPDHAPVILRLAAIDREMGDAEQARRRLEEALKQNPGLVEVRLELSRVLYEAGDIDGATAQTKKILETDPKNVDALYNLGAINANHGKVAEAGKYWDEARRLGPDTPSGKKAAEGLKQLGL
jgi:tetratricopeptide (TPR) repeat protein